MIHVPVKKKGSFSTRDYVHIEVVEKCRTDTGLHRFTLRNFHTIINKCITKYYLIIINS